MISKVTKDDFVKQPETHANISPAEIREKTIEAVAEVTPEMIEAGKLALSPSNDQNKSLEQSVGEVYVAMAAEDHAAISEQKKISEIKHSNHIKILLYFGTCAMLILAVGLLAKVAALF